MTIGEIIKEKRIACGLTQKQLAKKVGLTNASVSNIEKGLTCNVQSLILICDALDLTFTIVEKHSQTINQLDYDINLCCDKIDSLKSTLLSIKENNKKFK